MHKVGHPESDIAFQIQVTGRVQGVGFRPFIYRIAHQYHIAGWVQNHRGEVLIHAEGLPADMNQFIEAIIHAAPPLSRPIIDHSKPVECERFDQFSIKESTATNGPTEIHLPPDHFTCSDCIDELNTPANRRYQYPFINCTQCGSRYTIIKALPYDRPATSMAEFSLCPECKAEYLDPLDRRFHAEPLACPSCGPQLQFCTNGSTITGSTASLSESVNRLRAGEIVAVKGIGGKIFRACQFYGTSLRTTAIQ